MQKKMKFGFSDEEQFEISEIPHLNNNSHNETPTSLGLILDSSVKEKEEEKDPEKKEQNEIKIERSLIKV